MMQYYMRLVLTLMQVNISWHDVMWKDTSESPPWNSLKRTHKRKYITTPILLGCSINYITHHLDLLYYVLQEYLKVLWALTMQCLVINWIMPLWLMDWDYVKHKSLDTNITVHIHTYIHTYIHACIHRRIHTYIHTYLHTYIHT